MAPLRGRLNFPGHSLTLIAKVKLALVAGGVARVVSSEPSFPTGDQPYDDDALGLGTPRYASDFAFQKPSADVLVVGHFHAPEQKPVRASEVAVSIGADSTRLSVIGRRRFYGGGRLPTANDAEPFKRLALRWENAYGGPGHTHNPVGTGYVAGESPRGTPTRDFAREPLELPRIERPDRLFTHSDQVLEPVCFAPRAVSWPVRRDLFGKCDEAWLKTRWPWFPEDFDPRYFMAALPALQQRAYLRGDERLRFKNMHAQLARYETSLPGLRAIGIVQRLHTDGSSDATNEPVTLNLDTLWIDMDDEVALLVFRGSVVCKDAEASDIRHAWVGLESTSLALTPAEISERGARAIAEDEAQWNIAAAAPPAPEVADPAQADEDEAPDPELRAILDALPKVIQEPPPPITPEQAAVMAAASEKAERALEAELDAEERAEAAKKPPRWTRERVRSERARPGALQGADLSELDLSGEDLSGVDLTGALMRSTRLERANLRGADLSRANLEGAYLDLADLSEATLEDADLSKARGKGLQIEGAKLARANLSGCDFPAATLRAVDLTLVHAKGAQLAGTRFTGCQLAEASFDEANLEHASFEQCDASGARFVDAKLTRATFQDCVLKEADFEKSELLQATLVRCDLDDVMLEAAQASGLTLEASSVARLRAAGADLSFADWRDVSGKDLIGEAGSLADARLHQCHLPGADLSGVDLTRARISGCNLVGAKFARADFSDALVLGSDCFEASFEAARLLRCDGSGSSFFRAEFLEADVADFHGQRRDLTGTKLAPEQG